MHRRLAERGNYCPPINVTTKAASSDQVRKGEATKGRCNGREDERLPRGLIKRTGKINNSLYFLLLNK